MSDARGVAFSVLGYISPVSGEVFSESWKCSGVPSHFVSFVIINDTRPEDNRTELTVSVTSITGDLTPRSHEILASKDVYIKCVCVCVG